MNTCLNADNADELIDFMKFVYEELPSGRPVLADDSWQRHGCFAQTDSSGKASRDLCVCSMVYDRYAERMFQSLPWASREAMKVAYAGTLAFHNKIQYANYLQSTRWPMACTAGETFCVIDYNGDVRACELRGKLAEPEGLRVRLFPLLGRRNSATGDPADRLRPVLVYPCLQYSRFFALLSESHGSSMSR